jgi:hypothetical protein
MLSPVRMAGQTACPEGVLARARKRCHGRERVEREMKVRIADLSFEI